MRNETQRQELLEKLLSIDADDPAPPAPRKIADLHGCDHWPRPVLLERATYLRKLAKLGDGTASETIKELPGHRTMLCVRLRSGMAEMHSDSAEIFVILEGRATLVSGGAIENGKRAASGSYEGPSIAGGSRQELRPGDIVHVAPEVPFQFLLSGDATLSCLVMRVQRTEETS